MENKHVTNLMQVWKSANTILKPVDKEIIIEIIDQIASLFSAGNFYYFILNFETYKFDIVSDGTRSVLGIEPYDFSLEKFLELLSPEHLEKLHEKESAVFNFLLHEVPKEDIKKYKVVYLMRIKCKNGMYKTILHQAIATSVSDNGKIFQAMSIHTDVTHLNIPIDHKISFISNERPSYYSLDTGDSFELVENKFDLSFTHRELQIIKEVAKGKTFSEIAEILYVSPNTINTHKKNILKKSGCKNTAQLITKCIREGII